MKLFQCQDCANLLYFENTSCEKCGHQIGYIPEKEVLSAVDPDGDKWIALADPARRYRFCPNWELQACNWLVEVQPDQPLTPTFCRACQHNRTIPDVSDPARLLLWQKMETAKRRLFYSLIKLDLPLPRPDNSEAEPLQFEFLDDEPVRQVMTGHDSGTITISLKEADDAERERIRTSLHEPYRTLLGHFRHEVGHFYWDRLVRDEDRLEECRAIFGDERANYDEALQRYYVEGPAPDWQERCVSGYATMHPWEDFAETWAHYLHIVDTLEMAYAFGISVSPRIVADEALNASVKQNPYRANSIDQLISEWLPITFAVNSLNRTMGQPDLYPFIVSAPVLRKLEYIRELAQRKVLPVRSGTAKASRWKFLARFWDGGRPSPH